MKSFATIALAAATLTITTDAATLRTSNMAMSKKNLATIKALADKYDCEAAGDIDQTITNIEDNNQIEIDTLTETCTTSTTTHTADLAALESSFAISYNGVDAAIAEETASLLGPINTAYEKALKYYCEPSLLPACTSKPIGSDRLITIEEVGKDLVSWKDAMELAKSEYSTAELAYNANYASHVTLNTEMEKARDVKKTHETVQGTCPFIKEHALDESWRARNAECQFGVAGFSPGTARALFNTAIGICDQIRDAATSSITAEEQTIEELEVLTEDLAHCEGNEAASSTNTGAVTSLLEEKMKCAKEHKKITVFLEMKQQTGTSFLQMGEESPPVAQVVEQLQTQVNTETATTATNHASCVELATANRDAICAEGSTMVGSSIVVGSAVAAFNVANTAAETAFTTCLENADNTYSSWLEPQVTELDNEYKICCNPTLATSLSMVSNKASANWSGAKLYAAGALSAADSNKAYDTSTVTTAQETKAINEKSRLQIEHDASKTELEFEESQTSTSCTTQLAHLEHESQIIEQIRNSPDMQNQLHQDDDVPGQTETGSTETGSTETGSTNTGSTEAGSTEAGSTEAGSTETGSTEAGSTPA